MNKQTLIGVIVGILVIGGGAFYLLTREDNGGSNFDNAQNSSNTENTETLTDPENPVFEALATTNESFVVDLETTSDDTPFVGKISHDGKGNSLFEGKFKDDELKFYDIDGKYISCQNDTCFSIPDGQNGVDRSTYEYDESTLNDYREDAVYAGKADCPAGTCDKWTVDKDDVDVVIYVAADGRISKAEGTAEGSVFTAVFTYQDVTITAPSNVQEFPLN